MPTREPLVLILPSDLSVLPVVRKFVEAVCQLGGLDQTAMEAIVLATNEATSNVIRHAHQGRRETPVRVECILLDEAIEVSLYDQGEPFDVAGVPHLDPAEMRVGGRGVFLMRALVDELTCCRGDNGGNVLRMVKRSGGAAAAAPQQ